MAAIKPAQAAAYLRSPPANVSAVLFYGTDPGMVSERADHLARLIAERENPPGEVLRLDDSDLDEDPARIAIELDTRPMFSGRKVIRAAAGRRVSATLLKEIIEGGPREGVLIVEAGNLKSSDALRSLFERAPHAAAIGCYGDDAAGVERLVGEVLGQFKLQITPQARDDLVARLGADRALSRAEIEKLALYVLGRDTVQLEDVEAVVGDAAQEGLERVAEAAASGQVASAVSELSRALAAGENAQIVILITQRYFQKLHRIRSDLDAGRSLEDALRGLRPPLHFKQQGIIGQQVRRWTLPMLTQALMRISESAKSARRTSAMEDTLAERLLLALGAMANTGARDQAASTGAARRR